VPAGTRTGGSDVHGSGAITGGPPNSAVGTAARYVLDGAGIESRGRARFCAPVQTGPGAHSASYTKGTGFSPGGKAAGAWRCPPPPSSAGVKERVIPLRHLCALRGLL
jgi:hypothetical protein